MKMAKKKQQNEEQVAGLSAYQKGDTQTLKRSDLKEAVYNPRLIDEKALKRLKEGIKQHGLIGASIVWNKRTGNIVSGHQRLKALDALEQGRDYDLQVTVIDVPEKEEKILNVQLNNVSMMGEWNIEKLGEMFENDGFSAEELGFSDLDVDIMFGGDDRFSELFEDSSGVKATKEEIQKIKENRSEMMDRYKGEQSADFFFVVVCETQEDKDDLLREISLPRGEQFVSSEHVRRLKALRAKKTEEIISFVSEDQKSVIFDKINKFIESEGLTGDYSVSRAIEYMIVDYEIE